MVNVLLSILACIAAFAALIRALRDHATTRGKLRELELKAATLQRALKERSDLANEIAHEIKNPITAILCSAEALELLVSSRLEPSHRQCLHYIKEYGDLLLRLVSDFLDLNRAEGGNIQSQPKAVDLDELTGSVFGLLQANALKKHVTLKHEKQGKSAWADPRLCKQVLFNLVHNSIKFVPNRGEVTVSLYEDEEEGKIRIQVKDNGRGIPEKDFAVLFNPYASSARSENNDGSGCGLGLAVCRALVEIQGGKIRAFNNPEGGASFEFSLPVRTGQKQEMAVNEEDPLQVEHPLEGRRFLLVNKEGGSRDAMARLIGAWGAMVDQVSAAAEAIRALSDNFYDAVLIDDCAEGINNEEAARLIEDDIDTRSTKILYAATNREPGQLDRFSSIDGPEVRLSGTSLLKSLHNTDKV